MPGKIPLHQRLAQAPCLRKLPHKEKRGDSPSELPPR
jgi:hypothetical protein